MDLYDAEFAHLYDALWSGFARSVAPTLYAYYQSVSNQQGAASMLDLCCGAGQVARLFADHGFRVIGLDLSPAMLALARRNNGPYIESGQVRLIEADAADFRLAERVDLVVSTYNSLNHMPDEDALRRCFACVHEATTDDGLFIFDMKPRAGLTNWNHAFVHDTNAVTVVMKGRYDGLSTRASTRVTAFVRNENGDYRRLDRILVNTVFKMATVKALLHETGWRQVHFARIGHLDVPLDDPEAENRVFIVARKSDAYDESAATRS